MKFIQCRKCKNRNLSLKSGKPIAEPGYIVKEQLGEDGKNMVEVLEECECHKEWRTKQSLITKAKYASLSPRWIDFDITKDYVGDESKECVDRLINYVHKSLDTNTPFDVREKLAGVVMYIYGKNGTQKTTVVNWMGYEFLKKGKTVKYLLMNELIKMLQKADRDEDIQEKIEKLLDVDLLIIDESFDKEKVTIYRSGFQFAFIDSYLRNRIQTKHKGIVFVSNVNPNCIESIGGFTHSIEDLILRNIATYNSGFEFKDNYYSIKSTVDVEDLF